MYRLYYFLLFISIIICNYYFNINSEYKNFSELPILNEGRIKPLESFAKSNFQNFFVKDKGKPYSYYMAEIIFNFKNFSNEKIIYIKNSDIIVNLNLNISINNLYSFNDILKGVFNNLEIINNLIKTDISLLNNTQIELINFYNKINFILNISESFKILNNLELSNIDYENSIINYIYIIKTYDLNWIDINTGLRNNNLKIILYDIKTSYIQKKYKQWGQNCLILSNYNKKNLTTFEILKINIEIIYNKINLLLYGVLSYFISFILSFFKFKDKNFIYHIKYIFFIGFLSNFMDIFLRLFISEHPPVTNLYESFIFVTFICSLIFLFLLNKIKKKFFIIIIIMILLLLQIISYNYNNGSEIKNLVSVLNTNFWLTLHVLTITIGYACCLITSGLGHICMFYYFKKDNYKKLYNYTYTFVIISLLFMLNGTILGGIWADQSWGRFWGWDPKENGALLIVLCLILILHIRLLHKRFFFILCVALLNIAVVLSWFGVNLLNVGLHSYGFIQGVNFWLIFFITIEIIYIIMLSYICNKFFIRGWQ